MRAFTRHSLGRRYYLREASVIMAALQFNAAARATETHPSHEFLASWHRRGPLLVLEIEERFWQEAA